MSRSVNSILSIRSLCVRTSNMGKLLSKSLRVRRTVGIRATGFDTVLTEKCAPLFFSGMKTVASGSLRKSSYFVSLTTPTISYWGSLGPPPPKCKPGDLGFP